MSILAAFYGAMLGAGQAGAVFPEARFEQFDFSTREGGVCAGSGSSAGDPRCEQWSARQRFRGRWLVTFEASIFTFAGRRSCFETHDGTCIDLEGEPLPWPGRWDCTREYDVDFIGRRSLLPLPGHLGTPAYRITVDRLVSAKRLPDPHDDNCEETPGPEPAK